MEIPLKLKWLGHETAEICSFIAPFHPLILISPVPQLPSPEIPRGLVALPRKIYKVWDLYETGKKPREASMNCEMGASNGLAFDVLELKYDAQSFSAVYQFYFEVYLQSSALEDLPRTIAYHYLPRLQSGLLERKFIALISVSRGMEKLGGILLRHPSADELAGYQQRLKAIAAIARTDLAIIDLICIDARLAQTRLESTLVRRAAQWTQQAGYSFLSSAPVTNLVVSENECDEDWILEREVIPVWQEDNAALLYCDLRRCSYLSKDVHYYSHDEKGSYLYYIANVEPRRSLVVRLLSSLVHIEKRVYTRHAGIHEALSTAGIPCEFLASQSGSQASIETSGGSLCL